MKMRFIPYIAFTLFGLVSVAEPSREELEAASLLASRATFGMSYDEIVDMAEQGLDEWLNEQLEMDCSLVSHWEDLVFEMDENGELDELRRITGVESDDPFDLHRKFGPFYTYWYMTARYAPDQLCQRVAWALSQILVISTNSVPRTPYSHSTYYDILLRNAFGNYRQMLEDVTYSPQMGFFLSHVNNSRPRPEIKRFPDENYARELMQLFSLGLFELNTDGTAKLDEDGEFIATYDVDDITHLARVMTGLAYDGEHARFNGGWTRSSGDLPMMAFEWHHDSSEKIILGDQTLPAGQRTARDISDALDVIHAHANVGPFLGRQLIQRLVTSNPEPEYVRRVAEAFNDDGSGVRGNLKHVVKTILTDEEARNPSRPERFGKLREPIVRVMNLHRMFPTVVDGEDQRGLSNPFYIPLGWTMFAGNQIPLSAPSVFNFYSPFHSPKGVISEEGMVAPEFQIFDMRAAHRVNNLIWERLREDPRNQDRDGFLAWFDDGIKYSDNEGKELFWHPKMAHDISDYIELADSPSDLVDRLDLVMTHGSLNRSTRSRLLRRIGNINRVDYDNAQDYLRDRVMFAIWYLSTLPDYMIETY